MKEHDMPRQTLASLRSALLETDDLLEAERAARAKAEAAHKADVERIASHLEREAKNRGWCSEYADVMNEINEDMTVPLPPPSQEFEGRVEYAVTITLRSEYHTFRAQEDADNQALIDGVVASDIASNGAIGDRMERVVNDYLGGVEDLVGIKVETVEYLPG